MDSHDQLKAHFLEHCFGVGNPSAELLERGTFPKNWVSHYVALVERAAHVWKAQAVLALGHITHL